MWPGAITTHYKNTRRMITVLLPSSILCFVYQMANPSP